MGLSEFFFLLVILGPRKGYPDDPVYTLQNCRLVAFVSWLLCTGFGVGY
jgi:hypothetical protein